MIPGKHLMLSNPIQLLDNINPQTCLARCVWGFACEVKHVAGGEGEKVDQVHRARQTSKPYITIPNTFSQKPVNEYEAAYGRIVILGERLL